MLASELRIGNIVNVGDKTLTVESIHNEGVNYYQSGPYNDDSFEGYFDSPFNRADNIIGIPLTEGWLLKFRFEKCAIFSGTKYKLDVFEILNDVDFGFIIAYMNPPLIAKPIESVHQLQNLYFALTGTELKLSQ